MNERTFLAKPHVTGNEKKYLIDALESNWVAPLGPYVDKFESALESYIEENSHCVAMSSGTAAIHIALHLLGVSTGDIVLCSSLTFIGSCNPILYLGAEPVFVDCDINTWCICPKSLELALDTLKKEGKTPKALVSVNLFGMSPNYNEIRKICDKYNVAIVEDAAESLGSKSKGRSCGTFGDFGIFSFNGNKIITTSGGGAIVCRSKEMADKVKFLITQARDQAQYYQHSEVGFNYRLSNITAAIGLAQLEDLEDKISKKEAIFRAYEKAFSKEDRIKLLSPSEDTRSNFWLSCMRIEDSSIEDIAKILKALNEKNIEGRHIWKPMHMQPLFENCRYFTSQEDNSNLIFETGMCLPSSCEMTSSKIAEIIKIISANIN